MGTDYCFEVKPAPASFSEAHDLAMTLVRIGMKWSCIRACCTSGNLENVIEAYRALEPCSDNIEPIQWRHEMKSVPSDRIAEMIGRVLDIARGDERNVATVGLYGHMRGTPPMADRDYGDSINFYQNQNWRGSISIDCHSSRDIHEDRDSKTAARLDLLLRLIQMAGLPLNVRKGQLDQQGSYRVCVETISTGIDLRTKNDECGTYSVIVTPDNRLQAIESFRKLSERAMDEIFGCSVWLGGRPETVRDVAKSSPIPVNKASFFTLINRNPGKDLLSRVFEACDQADVGYAVDVDPDADIRFFDVEVAKWENAFHVTLSSRDFWPIEKAAKMMKEQWHLDTEFVKEL